MATVTYEEQRTEREKEIDADVLERVLRGLAWLEKTHGPGWEDKIDMDAFNIASPRYCVLGQVYAEEASGEGYLHGYQYGQRLLPGSDVLETVVDYGFGFGESDRGDRVSDRMTLQETWQHVLTPLVKEIE